MSYFQTPLATKFPPLIPRHHYPPAAAMRGYGQEPAPADPGQQPVDLNAYLQQLQQMAQQYGQQLPGTQPSPVPPAPAPTPAPGPGIPQGNVQGADTSSTLFIFGAIALVAVVGGVFLLKER